MGAEWQQGTRKGVRPGASGEGGTEAAAGEESQASTALNWERALARSREATRVKTAEETAGYDKYVRWCGRTGVVRPPPTRSDIWS